MPAWDGPRADPERLRRHVELLTTEASPRDSDHPENLDKAADYIQARFAETGARVQDQAFEVRGRAYRNVIASFGPATGPLLIVGAHYDSFGDFGPNPGADDNASGTAGLLELARLLDGRALAHRVELVAYANEEPPYFGSPWMGSAVHARSVKDQDVRGMICLEMIGYFTDEQPWPHWFLDLLYPDRGDFIAIAGRWSDRDLAKRLKKSIRGHRLPRPQLHRPPLRRPGRLRPDQLLGPRDSGGDGDGYVVREESSLPHAGRYGGDAGLWADGGGGGGGGKHYPSIIKAHTSNILFGNSSGG